MPCLNPINGSACCKCKYDIMSADFLTNSSLVRIARALANISWIYKFNNNAESSTSVSYARLSCSNNIKLGTPLHRPLHLSVIKHMSRELFNDWYKYHTAEINSENYNFVTERLKVINNLICINKIHIQLLLIAKHLEE